VGMRSFSNLFVDGNRSRRKPFIVEIRSCNRNVQGGNLFIVENMFFKKCLKKETVHACNLFIMETRSCNQPGENRSFFEIV
jgi:hypothetical protein